MKIGLTLDETLDLPFGELKSLIAIEQIKHEGYTEKREEDFWELLEMR